ncbi:G-type lectin S-receptor-like serine/threonine-protein kinase SD1-1 [Salvia hispanica]|uniref:G-type lectin S-receptor-like serine/threonine-protein kinase SD1-1 n=1 Tax=Salvia hispanica TaxID=49212 RepID=UPI002009A1EA|nr:G-type lectin S-receptor-like serine/threonine-protein kinase SD1-1 [Salvia hispanica]
MDDNCSSHMRKNMILDETTSWNWEDESVEHLSLDDYESSNVDDEEDYGVPPPQSPNPTPQSPPNHVADSSPESPIRKTRSLREIYEVSEFAPYSREPENFEVANSKKIWRKAMEEEIAMIDKNNTWELPEELEEEVFDEQPQDFCVEGEEAKVYKLKKALYGLIDDLIYIGSRRKKRAIFIASFTSVAGGMLEDEQEIAVKCLARNSSQGVDQLKNELILIAKLQHWNLVRLLGGYQTKSRLLNWEKRFNIINGIAKGILYLHQDSRLRIIHRDLKASNILLDADMNPKISDFGLARTFAGNETEAKTRRVVGTYGYMSPEYAIDGVFSVKSDVFSFGVLVLEIVCGKRNRGFCLEDHDINLLGHAWRLYTEDKTSQLLDTSLVDSLDTKQALRSIHVALFCVQKSPDDRPSMSSVVFMLGNEISIAQAKELRFFTERDVGIAHKCNKNSENQVSMSLIQGK